MPRIEVLPNSTQALAPGWAYVAVPQDGYLDPSKAPILPSTSRRKRTAATGASAADSAAANNSRQQTAVVRRLAELDRDGSAKEIPIPASAAGGAGGGGGRTQGKTQATRKILASLKTFANHLADEEAWLAQGHSAHPVVEAEKSKKKSRASVVDRGGATPMDVDGEEPSETDVSETMLATDIFQIPSEAELEALVSAPPLSYNAARAGPPDQNGPPQRVFCEICGYWGRVQCLKCGSRVCGLDCKNQHMLDCARRFA